MKKLALATICTMFLTLVWFPANAQESQGSLINEARFGGHWAQPGFMETGHTERDQYAASVELLFQPINIDVLNLFDSVTDTWVYSFVTPRPHIGAFANFSNESTSYVYGGLTWHFDVTEILFIRGVTWTGLHKWQYKWLTYPGSPGSQMAITRSDWHRV